MPRSLLLAALALFCAPAHAQHVAVHGGVLQVASLSESRTHLEVEAGAPIRAFTNGETEVAMLEIGFHAVYLGSRSERIRSSLPAYDTISFDEFAVGSRVGLVLTEARLPVRVFAGFSVHVVEPTLEARDRTLLPVRPESLTTFTQLAMNGGVRLGFPLSPSLQIEAGTMYSTARGDGWPREGFTHTLGVRMQR